MFNFIVCDDHKVIRNNVERVIDQVMMKNANAYKKHIFDDYNEDFNKVMKGKLASKIYILDLETKTSSGTLIAEKIREKDIDSIIILLTSHDEMAYEILKNQFMCLTFISKKDEYLSLLKRAISKAIQMVGKKQAIRFKTAGIIYTIPINDILYITRDSVERKGLIKTDYGEFLISKSLCDLRAELNSDFVQTHRACFINKNRFREINTRSKKIVFDSGDEIKLLSDSFKKDVYEECCK